MQRAKKKLHVDTFPFLAVLLCAMGSLILLLMVMDRRAKAVTRFRIAQELEARQEQRDAKHAAKLGKAVANRQAEWEIQRDKLHQTLLAQEAELRGQLASMARDAKATTQKTDKKQDDVVTLQNKLALEYQRLLQERQDLTERKTGVAIEDKKATEAKGQMQRLTLELLQLEKALLDLKALKSRPTDAFSLVPYRGKFGDKRKPVYVECYAEGIVIHPNRTIMNRSEVTPDQFRQEIENRAGNLEREKPQEPRARALPPTNQNAYVLFLVRPEGVQTYYDVTAALRGYAINFGYELVETSWVFDFSNEDMAAQQPWNNDGRGPGKDRPLLASGSGWPGRPGTGASYFGPGSLVGPPGSGPPGSGYGTGPPGSGTSGSGSGGPPGSGNIGPGSATGGPYGPPGSGGPRPGISGLYGPPGSGNGPPGSGNGPPGSGNGPPGSGIGQGGSGSGLPGASGSGTSPSGNPGSGSANGNGSGTGLGNGASGQGTSVLAALTPPPFGSTGGGNSGPPGTGVGSGPSGSGKPETGLPDLPPTGLPRYGSGGGGPPGTGIGASAIPRPGFGSGSSGDSPPGSAAVYPGQANFQGNAPTRTGTDSASQFGDPNQVSAQSGQSGSPGSPGSPNRGYTTWSPGSVGAMGMSGTPGSSAPPSMFAATLFPQNQANATNQPGQGNGGTGGFGVPQVGGNPDGAPNVAVAQADPLRAPGQGAGQGGGGPGFGNSGGGSSGGSAGGTSGGGDGMGGSPSNMGNLPSAPGGAPGKTAPGTAAPEDVVHGSGGGFLPPGLSSPAPPSRGKSGPAPLSRLMSNHDYVITIECLADGVVISPRYELYPMNPVDNQKSIEKALIRTIQTLIDRRQASVRPGEPAYRPMIRLQVEPDALRTYYWIYPVLQELRIPMFRENLEN